MAQINDSIEEIVEKTQLSEREAQVFCLQNDGLSRREIAEELKLNKNTVDTYVRRIRDKRATARRTLDIKQYNRTVQDFKDSINKSFEKRVYDEGFGYDYSLTNHTVEFEETEEYAKAIITTDGLNKEDNRRELKKLRSVWSLHRIEQKDGKIEIELRYYKQ
jgi:DNA-binding CsgD family transcriptional regulator